MASVFAVIGGSKAYNLLKSDMLQGECIEQIAINRHDMNCKCQLSTEGNKKNGIIGDDWQEWIVP